ncbi:MAG TPA: cell wall anchor protein, partial [Micromonosporaceae bacterium]|nr:cell wall anchor protein [Micromonosporaceae bacterium]
MNRPKLSLRRPLAVLGATFVGLAAAVAVAAPASAHHPEIAGTGCKLEDGSVKVTWTVTNSETEWTAEILEISSPSGAPVS